MNDTPKPRRTLRNEIARHILDEGYEPGLEYGLVRTVIQDATLAVDALRNFVLVFGPEALIEAL